MSIGGSLLLILVGAVLTFAVTAKPHGVNLGTLGVVFMVVGVIAMTLTLTLQQRRRSILTRRKVFDENAPGPGQVIEESRTYEDPPQAY